MTRKLLSSSSLVSQGLNSYVVENKMGLKKVHMLKSYEFVI